MPVPQVLYPLTTIVERLDLAKLFARPQPLQVELGAGDGTFLMEWAKLHPQFNFIGVERLLGRARKMDRKGRRAGLANMRVVRIEASYFLKWLLPARSAQVLHAYFPDPWPKRRHWNRRLVNAEFVALAAQALVPGGVIYIRTDNPGYFEHITSVFAAASGFRPRETPTELQKVLTDFERYYHAQGVPTLRAAYELVEAKMAEPSALKTN